MTVHFDAISEALQRIRPYVHKTPVVTSEILDKTFNCSLFFKCENLQKTGAFKIRGATNALLSIAPESLINGVATHSSGNHGASLAKAAQLGGIRAFIVMPENAASVKRQAVLAYGGEVVICEPTLLAREAMLGKVIEEHGATFVHPYDDNDIISGQGTVGIEIIDQVKTLDSLLVPVGGGGLLAGVATSVKHLCPGCEVFGVEPLGAADAHESFDSGTRVTHHDPTTIADGLLTTLGERNFMIIRELVDDILLVSDSDIVMAMRMIWTRMKLIVEPSAAVTLAAVMTNTARFTGQRVGLVLSGGNVDLDALPW